MDICMYINFPNLYPIYTFEMPLFRIINLYVALCVEYFILDECAIRTGVSCMLWHLEYCVSLSVKCERVRVQKKSIKIDKNEALNK